MFSWTSTDREARSRRPASSARKDSGSRRRLRPAVGFLTLLGSVLTLQACDQPVDVPEQTPEDFEFTYLPVSEQTADGLPAGVTDLTVDSVGDRWVSVSFTQVEDGLGNPADYLFRYAEAPFRWDYARGVRKGPCRWVIQGTAIGDRVTCIADRLKNGTTYDLLVVSARKENGDYRFGHVSNTASAVPGQPAPVPSALRVLDGAGQEGTVGARLGQPLVIQVVDAAGRGVPGAPISWNAVAGSLAADTVADNDGLASAWWTLGTTAGMQNTTAAVADVEAITFEAMADAAAAAEVSLTPSGATLDIGDTLTFAVSAVDEFGNAVDHAGTWTSSDASRASVSGAGLVTAVRAGAVTVTATVDGVARSADVTVRAGTPGAVSDLTVDSVGTHWMSVSFTEVADGAGGPASYQLRWAASPIQWGSASVPQTGSCAWVFSGTQVGNRRTCIIDGLSEGTRYDARLVSQRRNADGSTTFGPLSSIATGTTEATPVASDVALTAGNGQSGPVATALPGVLSVRVVDQFGAPMSGVPVTWTAAAGSMAVQAPATDGSGISRARWTLGTTAGVQTAAAAVSGVGSVAFQAQALAGPATTVSVTPGSATLQIGATASFSASAADAHGNPVEGGITWTSSNTTVATVDADGRATARAGGTASITAAAGAASGTGTVTVESGIPAQVSDLATDSAGADWISVTFTEVGDGAGGASAYQLRYALRPIQWGSAAVPQSGSCAWVFGGTAVGNRRTCTVRGLAAGATYDFRLVSQRRNADGSTTFGPLSNVATGTTGAVAGPSTVAMVSGNGQAGTVGSALPDLLTVRVLDQNGQPSTGVAVSWSTPNGSVTAQAGTTDAQGLARGRWTLGTAAGSQSATATVAGVGTVAFQAQANPGAAATLALSPASSTLNVGGAVTLAPTVRDAHGNPVSATLSWQSSNPAVAAVDGSGRVTALAGGNATVTAVAGAASGAATIAVQTTVPAPAITTTGLPSGQVGSAYDASLAATGGNGSFTWAVTAGSLPNGLSLNATTGRIQGTPTSAGTSNFTVRVSSAGQTASRALSLQVASAPPPPSGGAWVDMDWSEYDRTSDLDYDPTGQVNARMISNYGPDGQPDGTVELLTNLTNTPWGGSKGVAVTYFDRSEVACGHGPEVGVRLNFPQAQIDRPQEIWYEVWVRFDSHWRTNFCGGFAEQKGISLYDDQSHRWNLMIGSGTSMIRPYIDNWEYSGAATINAALPAGSNNVLDAREVLWDGQWHQIRYHAKMGNGTGELEVWIDGQKVFDEDGLRSQDNGAAFFRRIYLSSYMNHRPTHNQTTVWGPFRAWITNPGW